MKKYIFVITALLFLASVLKGYGQVDTIFKSLTVNQVDEGVLVNFTIRGGITCSGVTIQRSVDGIFFEDVYEFVGVCGAINTDESYSYTDENPLINVTSYYRLDLASLHLYSDIINVRYIDYSKGAVVFPNPCRDNCTIYFSNNSNASHEIKLFDKTGSNILNNITEDGFWFVPADKLPTGYYYFIIYREGEERYTGNLVIL